MSNPSLPPESTIEQLIGLGFVVTAAAGKPNLSTIELVPYLLKNLAYANTTLAPFLPPDLDPATALHQLDAVLPLLPRDEIWLKYSIVLAVMSFVSFLVVGLRFYVRLRITPKRLRLEDWVCLATLIFIQAWIATMGAGNRWAGRHIYLLSLKEIREHQLFMSFNGFLFNFCHQMVKYTFLVFYYRLYPNKWYHRAVLMVAAFVCVICTVPGVLLVFGCRPFDFWNHLLTAKCWDRLGILTGFGVTLILADFMILSLPIPVVLRLSLKTRDRVLLIGLFALGGFISIVSIIRLLALRRWLQSADFTYTFGNNMIWSCIEVVMSLVVACAPALKAGVSRHKSPAIAQLPKGFSKWSFTPGGMFKRSRRATEKGSPSEYMNGGRLGASEVPSQNGSNAVLSGSSSGKYMSGSVSKASDQDTSTGRNMSIIGSELTREASHSEAAKDLEMGRSPDMSL